MGVAVRRNLVFVWLAVLTVALGLMLRGHAAAGHKVTDIDEINVHRINIIEPDGKPRVIISNRASMAGVYWAGKEYNHAARDSGGLLFFDDEGTEVGGMLFNNRRQGDNNEVYSGLTLDQFHQDETLMLMYNEEKGRRAVGMMVQDRPNESLLPVIELSDKLAKATTDAERARIASRCRKSSSHGEIIQRPSVSLRERQVTTQLSASQTSRGALAYS
jgi:hypothetical protein